MDSGPAPRGASRNDEKTMPSSRQTFAFSRHAAPELCKFNDPQERAQGDPQERAQGRPGARCTRGLACKGREKDAHEHTGSAEAVRPSLRNGFTAYFELSPVIGFLATVARKKRASCELDGSIGAAGPH